MLPKSVGVATSPKPIDMHTNLLKLKNSQPLKWISSPLGRQSSCTTTKPHCHHPTVMTTGLVAAMLEMMSEPCSYIKPCLQKIIKIGTLKMYFGAHKPFFLILGHIWRLYLCMLLVLL